MILPAAFISVIFFISASLGSENTCHPPEEECETINVQRYFEKCHKKETQLLKCRTDLQNEGLEKYAQISKCQQDYSDLVKSNLEVQNKYMEVLSQLKDTEVKYEKLLSKQKEVDNLINQKIKEIELLKDQNRNLKTTSELAMLTNQFREDIDKLGKIVKIGGMDENNLTKSEVETGEVTTTPLPNINNETTSQTETIDPCPRNQKEYEALREIQLPSSDPFKVVCRSYMEGGSGWLIVYKKQHYSQKFHRTYEDYERGFGDVGTGIFDEFFIGLNRLHLLTSENAYEVLLATYPGPRRCDNFVVGDRSEGHKVKSIGNCTGNDVWISPKLGTNFSTFDRDEDGASDRNLAEEGGFGWWFDPDMSPDQNSIFVYVRRTY